MNYLASRTRDRLAAVRLDGGKAVHAGFWRAEPDLYAPCCGTGRRHQNTRIPTVLVAIGKAVDEEVTCRNCKLWHADAVSEVRKQQFAARLERLNARNITHYLPQMVVGLAASITSAWPADALTCSEVDSVALVLLAGGQRDTAERLIASHANGFDAQDSEDHAHHCEDTSPEAVARFAADYVTTLITCHADGMTASQRHQDDPLQAVFSVYLRGPYRHEGHGGWLYVVPASNEEQAAQRALAVLIDDMEGPDFVPEPLPGDEPAYIVASVSEGLPGPGSGHFEDLRNCRF